MRLGRAALLAAIFALLPSAAAAIPLCDSPEGNIAFYRAMIPWRNALPEKKFAELDRQFNGLLADYESGKLTDHEVHRWFENFAYWEPAREPLHEDWIRAFPNSAAARLARAYYYMTRGYNARGGDWAGETSAAQLQAMGEEFRKAFTDLDKADALTKKPTLGIAMRIRMLGATGDPSGSRKRELYLDAVKRFPDTLQVRVQRMAMSHPKWGGSRKQIADAQADAKGLGKDERRFIEYVAIQEIGSAYHWEKDYKRAAEFYEKSIPLCPGLEGALRSLVGLYKETRNFDALIPLMGRFVELHPRDGWGFATRAWAYTEKRDWQRSYADYDKAASLGSQDGFEGLAWHYESGHVVKQDYRRAIDLYELAAERGSTTAGPAADKVRKGAGIQMR